MRNTTTTTTVLLCTAEMKFSYALWLMKCSSADLERDWPPCKVVFFGLAIIALNVRNNNNKYTVGSKELRFNFNFYTVTATQVCTVLHIHDQ